LIAMSRQERGRLVRQFLESMSPGARWLLVAMVFLCFAPMGLLSDLSSLGQSPWYRVLFLAVWSGGLAITIAAASVSGRFWLIVLGVFGIYFEAFVVHRWLPEPPSPTTLGPAEVAALERHLTAIMGLTVADVVLVYVSFVSLMQGEGRRFMRAHTEIRLARAIHRSLVPELAGSSATLAWRGVSRPSGEVGGDLVDVIVQADGWLGCVADVSGHGVAAGVLMGMFKTAFHAAAGEVSDVGELLTRTNRVITPLKQSNMFVTAACLRMAGPGRMEYVLAGHPSLLQVRARASTAAWVGESQLAIGITADVRYETRAFEVERGDLVLVVTDGLLEVANPKNQELGTAGLARAVQNLPETAPLAEIEDRLFAACEAHGIQADDQTVLIIRIL
jgi:serine phosphatase RsbU (regulator of sigma subunit)